MTNAFGSFSSRANKGSNHPGVTTTWGSKNIKTLQVAEKVQQVGDPKAQVQKFSFQERFLQMKRPLRKCLPWRRYNHDVESNKHSDVNH